jgi:exopolysaccharide biosynthesis WecB/TagA/CpsF family protein
MYKAKIMARKIIMGKVELCSEIIRKITRVESDVEKKYLVDGLLSNDHSKVLGFINAHAINLAWCNADVASSFLNADYLLRDGKGLEIMFKRLGEIPGLNMNGTDFIPEILDAAKGRKIALYGTASPWLDLAVKKLRNNGHNIIDYHHGFECSKFYVDSLEICNAEIVILAMGMPKQEKIAALMLNSEQVHHVLIICGGAILDFISNRSPRAHEWLRKAGFEWMFCLIHEPVRLFKRYVIGNFLFLLRINQIQRFYVKNVED